MRINKFVALASDLSRRAADTAIQNGRILINGKPAVAGDNVLATDVIALDGAPLRLPSTQLVMLHKPVGYVVSRDGQGSPTVYDLLPSAYRQLQAVGRLDKDSSGLLLFTNDGTLANELTHPRYNKQKVYQVTLDKTLTANDRQRIESGLELEDGVSRLQLHPLGKEWQVTMSEGRNRQIRRTFAALGYTVTKLQRVQLGSYRLDGLSEGQSRLLGA